MGSQFGAMLVLLSVIAAVAATASYIRRWQRVTGLRPSKRRLLFAAVTSSLALTVAINVTGAIFGWFFGSFVIMILSCIAVFGARMLPVPSADVLPYYEKVRPTTPSKAHSVETMTWLSANDRKALLDVLVAGDDHVEWCNEAIRSYTPRMGFFGRDPWAAEAESLRSALGLNFAAGADAKRAAGAIIVAALKCRQDASPMLPRVAKRDAVEGEFEHGMAALLGTIEDDDEPVVVVTFPAGEPISVHLKSAELVKRTDNGKVRAFGVAESTPVELEFSLGSPVTVIGL